MTYGSLFAGIGGFDLGFDRAGMTCKWQVEIDDYANRVLAKHWPNVRRWPDVRTWPQPDTERVDVICGGFPCQDISYAGLGAGLDGERSGLFFEAIRVVRQLRPRVVVLENVAALLTRGMDRVLGSLAQIGYDAEWNCIPAAAVGAPHIRDRVFILAYSNDSACSRFGQHSRQVLSKKESTRSGSRSSCSYVADASRELLNRDSIGTTEARRGKLADFGWWITEPNVGRMADGVPHRMDRLRGLGNAVVPQVAEWIGRRIMEAFHEKQA